ncbi:MAG: zinc ribbon domain-containing protein [Chloroflexi bacterium]|nr:zinc ribbon domain-containing protein [Chloroflexota bacterium]
MPDQPDQIDRTIGSDHIFCSHCGIENAKGGYSCTRCGERLIEIDTDTDSPMGLVSCARCGGANNTRAVHCWVCGTEMNDAVRISPAPQAKPARTASTYQPDLNPISVPAPTGEPKDERADLRGPARGSVSGPRPGTRIESAPPADGSATSEEAGISTAGIKGGEVPREIKRWNWAAFLVPPVWGIFSGVPLAALMLAIYLPFFPIWLRSVVWMGGSLYLGFRGNELAWRGKKWRSVQHFKSVQHRWLIWSIGLNLFGLILLLWLSGSAAEG